MGASPNASNARVFVFPAPNVEYENAVFAFLALEGVIACCQKMGDVDDTHRIRAFDDETLASSQSTQRLAGPQHRQRAMQAAQIENLRRHCEGARACHKTI